MARTHVRALQLLIIALRLQGIPMRSLFRLVVAVGCISLLAWPAASQSVWTQPGDPTPADIQQRVAAAKLKLGDGAGVPESPDRFVAIPKSARPLSANEAMAAFSPVLRQIEIQRWWRIGLDPTTLERTLREPASVISGCVAAWRAGLDGAHRALDVAKDAAEFLMWAQDQAGAGGFPFPGVRSGKSRALQSARVFLEKAERDGRIEQVIRNGWAIEDLGNGGLQFDNGEAGVAMFELFEATRDPRHLASARRAADWAAERPLATNWNYNSFSVHLLAKAYGATGEQRYLEAALRKALLGVIPGQLTDGPNTGRWLDPHNALPTYHYIMMRALAQLAAVTPLERGERAKVIAALERGLESRNRDFLGPGAPNKNSAMDALLTVNRLFAKDADFLRRTLSKPALERLAALVSAQHRRGVAPLDPREWGQFLAFVVNTGVN